MRMNEISERYASGLLELAIEEGSLSSYKNEVENLYQAFTDNKELNVLLNAVKVTREEKKDFLDKTVKTFCNSNITNFLKLMIDKGRSRYIQETLECFIELADEKLGILHAKVISARKLEETDLDKLKESLHTKTNKEIILHNEIDPSVIAGIKVIYDNTVIDMTMANKIEDMKSALMKGRQV